jgi:hypothetical protein
MSLTISELLYLYTYLRKYYSDIDSLNGLAIGLINSPYNSLSDSLTHITPTHLIKRPTNNNLNFK